MKKKQNKRIYTPKAFFGFVSDMVDHLGDVRDAHKGDRVSAAFRERLMLAVTQVNGCRYCSYGHTQFALKAGISQQEIQSLLHGEMGAVPAEETVALVFAQHYAESAGQPDAVAYQRLLDTYGLDTSRDILALIRTITVGNAYGNSLDAFLSRLKGKPFSDSRLRQELAIVVGVVFALPAIVVYNWVARLL